MGFRGERRGDVSTYGQVIEAVEMDGKLSDNRSEVKQWVREHGLTPGSLMGASR